MEMKDIASQAEDLYQKHQKTDWAAVAANLFLFPITYGVLSINTDDVSELRAAAMPDDWLKAVASLPNLSKKGLATLADDLTKNGFVSVYTARKFVEIETNERSEANSSPKEVASAGSAMILARAEKELPGTIKRFAESAKDVAGAMSGFASFTIEKSILAGKGLGAAAEFLKTLRK
ncbi:hypothetical protein [Herbaspirillum huttiense]|uniref:hypothetical protein n=1 Tax=Herbaspirillum huttiense TaxID=863372 RepID=UPI0039B06F89